MRRWERVTYRESCGRCGVEMPKGTAMMTIEVHGMRRVLKRCATCGGEAPPNLPELQEPESVEQKAAKLGMRLAAGIGPDRTRGALKTMAREYLPHPND